MKRLGRHKIGAVILTWIAIYTLVLLIGTLSASYYSYETNSRIPQLAASDAQYYVEKGAFAPKTSYYGNAAFIYFNDGEIVSSMSDGRIDPLFPSYVEKYCPMIDSEGSIYKFAMGHNSIFSAALIAAMPMPDGSGYYFFIRNLHSLTTLLTVLYSSMTIFLVLSILYSVLLVRANRKVEEMRRIYVANVSHELKSPIASIRALSESMYDGVIREEERRKKCLGIIISESHNLEHTVLSMLELSKSQSMSSDFKKSAVSPRDVFLPIIDTFSNRCSEMGIHFTPPQNLDFLPMLHTNAERIGVLTNSLLDNAIKFVSPGGHIELSAALHRKKIIFCVRDDGIGIEKSEQEKIFERFYTVDHARNSNGSGLGLAIAEEIVKGLNEKIWVESAPGKGSAFYFTISAKPE